MSTKGIGSETQTIVNVNANLKLSELGLTGFVVRFICDIVCKRKQVLLLYITCYIINRIFR